MYCLERNVILSCDIFSIRRNETFIKQTEKYKESWNVLYETITYANQGPEEYLSLLRHLLQNTVTENLRSFCVTDIAKKKKKVAFENFSTVKYG